MKKIKKQWCVYGLFPDSIGRVVAENDKTCSVSVICSEGQSGPANEVEKKCSQRFKTIWDAILFVANRNGRQVQEIAALFRQKFPSVKETD